MHTVGEAIFPGSKTANYCAAYGILVYHFFVRWTYYASCFKEMPFHIIIPKKDGFHVISSNSKNQTELEPCHASRSLLYYNTETKERITLTLVWTGRRPVPTRTVVK